MSTWKHSLSVLATFASFAGAPLALAQQPDLVTAPVEKVFVPLGFDDNDNVEVIVHGHFPSTCYKTGPASAVVDPASGVVTLDVKAYIYPGAVCAQVLIPFTQSVKLGLVTPGTYRMDVIDRPDAASPGLVVAQARTSNPDDFLYAPVAQASLDSDGAGQYTLKIAGEYPFFFIGCMVIREVRTYMSPGNTLVVMPISELTEGADCAPQAVTKKFEITRPVGALAAEEFMIHVRVMSGESVNRFVDLTP